MKYGIEVSKYWPSVSYVCLVGHSTADTTTTVAAILAHFTCPGKVLYYTTWIESQLDNFRFNPWAQPTEDWDAYGRPKKDAAHPFRSALLPDEGLHEDHRARSYHTLGGVWAVADSSSLQLLQFIESPTASS